MNNNVFILETDKPSAIYKDEVFQNIYVTNNENIKRGDHIIVEGHLIPHKCVNFMSNGDIECENGLAYKKECCFKIVLCTDKDLIKNGIQPLDDTFLERFVSNPVDYVEVTKYHGINTSIAEISAVSGSDDYNWKGIGDFRDYSVSFAGEKSLEEGMKESAESLKDMYEGISQEEIEEQIKLTEQRGQRIVGYLDKYKGQSIYNEIALAIEFGYQLAIEDDESTR